MTVIVMLFSSFVCLIFFYSQLHVEQPLNYTNKYGAKKKHGQQGNNRGSLARRGPNGEVLGSSPLLCEV